MKNLIKAHKIAAILSSVVILLPILIGLMLWNRLPPDMATHWGADGVADGFGGRGLAVFLTPVEYLLLHWLVLLLTAHDSRNHAQNPKVLAVLFWIMPVASLITSGILYASALGFAPTSTTWMLLLFGVLFIAFGNYFPKIRQNSTYGIKLPWTLSNEENWNRTHRFGAKIWVVGGILLLFTALLPMQLGIPVMVVVLLAVALIPSVYSYLLYRRQLAAGEAVPASPLMNRSPKLVSIVSLLFVLAIFVWIGFMLFTGSISFDFGDEALTIDASYYGDYTLPYAAVTAIDYSEEDPVGVRAHGFGSPILQMGTFSNDTYGRYTRYTYTRADAAIVVYLGEDVLVLSEKNDTDTRALYEKLCTHCGIPTE